MTMEDIIMRIPKSDYEIDTNTYNIAIMSELRAEHESMVVFAEYIVEIRAKGYKLKNDILCKLWNSRWN